MPISQPRSLSNDEVYALVAFILSVDGIVKPDAVMNAETLPQVKMPNRNGFIDSYGATRR
jgi:S-disulfanyl-L-cysteine oxidoreductase SoxD